MGSVRKWHVMIAYFYDDRVRMYLVLLIKRVHLMAQIGIESEKESLLKETGYFIEPLVRDAC